MLFKSRSFFGVLVLANSTNLSAATMVVSTPPVYLAYGDAYSCNVMNYSHRTVKVSYSAIIGPEGESIGTETLHRKPMTRLGPRRSTQNGYSVYFGPIDDMDDYYWGFVSCKFLISGKPEDIARVRAGLTHGWMAYPDVFYEFGGSYDYSGFTGPKGFIMAD